MTRRPAHEPMMGPGGRSVASPFLWLGQTDAGDRGPSKGGPRTVRADSARAVEPSPDCTRSREPDPLVVRHRHAVDQGLPLLAMRRSGVRFSSRALRLIRRVSSHRRHIRSTRVTLEIGLHRASIARHPCSEVPSAHRLGRRLTQVRHRLGVHVERQAGLRVTEHRLRRLHVNPLGHQPGRVRPTQIVEIRGPRSESDRWGRPRPSDQPQPPQPPGTSSGAPSRSTAGSHRPAP
jgi:hypothetical protein